LRNSFKINVLQEASPVGGGLGAKKMGVPIDFFAKRPYIITISRGGAGLRRAARDGMRPDKGGG